MIKVMVVDDCAIVRDGTKAMLEQAGDIKIVGCAANGREAADLCDQTRPDLVLMDIKMPVCDGVEGIRLIKEKDSSIKVVVLTVFEDQEYIECALNYGVDGYIMKDIREKDLIRVIRNTVNGLSVVHDRVFEKIRTKYVMGNNQVSKKIASSFTERELLAIKLIVDGMDKKEIAVKMHLAEGTVKNLISEILQKCNLKNRTQLAVFAIKNNLV